MTRNEIVTMMTWILANFPNMQEKEMKPTALLWERMFSDIPKERFEVALTKVLARSEFFPTVAAISKALVDDSSDLTAIEAWGEVTRAIRNFGWNRQKEALLYMSPLTKQVVQAFGWMDICSSEESEVIRGQFMNHYKTLQERSKNIAVLPKQIREREKGLIGDEKRIIEKEGV